MALATALLVASPAADVTALFVSRTGARLDAALRDLPPRVRRVFRGLPADGRFRSLLLAAVLGRNAAAFAEWCGLPADFRGALREHCDSTGLVPAGAVEDFEGVFATERWARARARRVREVAGGDGRGARGEALWRRVSRADLVGSVPTLFRMHWHAAGGGADAFASVAAELPPLVRRLARACDVRRDTAPRPAALRHPPPEVVPFVDNATPRKPWPWGNLPLAAEPPELAQAYSRVREDRLRPELDSVVHSVRIGEEVVALEGLSRLYLFLPPDPAYLALIELYASCCLSALDEFPAARSCLELVHALGERVPRPLLGVACMRLADFAFEEERYEEVDLLVRKRRRLLGDHPWLLSLYADSLWCQNRVRDSLEVSMRVTQLMPDWLETYAETGHARLLLGDFEAALRDFARAGQTADTGLRYAAIVRCGLALTLELTGAREVADEEFARSLACWPGNPYWYCFRGRVLEGRGEPAEARRAYARALRIDDPPLPEYWQGFVGARLRALSAARAREGLAEDAAGDPEELPGAGPDGLDGSPPDLVLAHAAADAPLVGRVAEELRAAGTRVLSVVFERDLPEGINPLVAVEELSQHRGACVVAFLTAEMRLRFRRWPAGTDVQPTGRVIFAGCGSESLPGVVAAAGYVDHQGRSPEELAAGLRAVVAALPPWPDLPRGGSRVSERLHRRRVREARTARLRAWEATPAAVAAAGEEVDRLARYLRGRVEELAPLRFELGPEPLRCRVGVPGQGWTVFSWVTSLPHSLAGSRLRVSAGGPGLPPEETTYRPVSTPAGDIAWRREHGREPPRTSEQLGALHLEQRLRAPHPPA